MQRIKVDIAVVGAGIVGLSAALAMARSGLTVALIDKKARALSYDAGIDPRAYAIRESSKQFLQRLNCWDSLERKTSVEAMHIVDRDESNRFEIHQDLENPLAYIVENALIQKVLVDRVVETADLQVLWEHQVEEIHFMRDKVQLDLGDKLIDAKLLIVADGANSSMRKLLSIDVTETDYQQKGVVCLIETQIPHQNVAYQWFQSVGVLAFLPMSEPHLSSIVFSLNESEVSAFLNADDDTFECKLHKYSNARLGKVHLKSKPELFPLKDQSVDSYLHERAVLVGDAAHVVHPLAGLGMNLGLSDVTMLSQVIVDAHKKGFDIGDKGHLRRFERARKFENQSTSMMMQGLHALFQSETKSVAAIRRLGLNGFNRCGLIKHTFKKLASGTF